MRKRKIRQIAMICCLLIFIICDSSFGLSLGSGQTGNSEYQYTNNKQVQQVFAQSQPRTIFIAGDSIAANVKAHYYPRTGWAGVFYQYFEGSGSAEVKRLGLSNSMATAYVLPGITIENHASSSESTKSYMQKHYFSEMLARVKKGDIVLLGFGHNDSNAKKTKKYCSISTYKNNLSYMIQMCQKKGASCYVMTPIPRYEFKKGTLWYRYKAYQKAVKEVAGKTGAKCIDLGSEMIQYYKYAGKKAYKALYMILPAGKYAEYPNGYTDKTHLNEKGAKLVAKIVANRLTESDMKCTAKKNLKVSTKQLKELLHTAERVKLKNYKGKSGRTLKSAIAYGKKIYYSVDATEKKVTNACEKLRKAMRNLKKVKSAAAS